MLQISVTNHVLFWLQDGRSTRTKFIDIPAPQSFLEREIVLEKRRLRVDDISHEVIEIKKVEGQISARSTSRKYHGQLYSVWMISR